MLFEIVSNKGFPVDLGIKEVIKTHKETLIKHQHVVDTKSGVEPTMVFKEIPFDVEYKSVYYTAEIEDMADLELLIELFDTVYVSKYPNSEIGTLYRIDVVGSDDE